MYSFKNEDMLQITGITHEGFMFEMSGSLATCLVKKLAIRRITKRLKHDTL